MSLNALKRLNRSPLKECSFSYLLYRTRDSILESVLLRSKGASSSSGVGGERK